MIGSLIERLNVFISPPASADAAQQAEADRAEAALRRRYLAAVTQDVTARLAASLHHARFLDLGVAHDPMAVRPPWGYYDPEAHRPYADIGDAFADAQRRLLILGDPGAGKTTTLLHLAQRLIREAETRPDAPLPIIVNLSGFRFGMPYPHQAGKHPPDGQGRRGRQPEPRHDIEAWLLAEMCRFPGLDAATARRWLDRCEVALLFDGLDEFDDERRGALASAFNTDFLARHPNLPVAICCRTGDYQSLATRAEQRLHLASAVRLLPLSDQQIEDYLTAAQAKPLLTAIRDDASLGEMARTPLMLSMLVLAHAGTPPPARDVAASFADTRHRLFQAYVARMQQRQARRDAGVPYDTVASNDVPATLYRYQPAAVDRWLEWLALTLSLRMQTAFRPQALFQLLRPSAWAATGGVTFQAAMAAAGVVPALGCGLVALALAAGTDISAVPAALCVAAGWSLVGPAAAASRHSGWRNTLLMVGLRFALPLLGVLSLGGIIASAAGPLLPLHLTVALLLAIVVLFALASEDEEDLAARHWHPGAARRMAILSMALPLAVLFLLPLLDGAEWEVVVDYLPHYYWTIPIGSVLCYIFLWNIFGHYYYATIDAIIIIIMLTFSAFILHAAMLVFSFDGPNVLFAVVCAVLFLMMALLDHERMLARVLACSLVLAAAAWLGGALALVVAAGALVLAARTDTALTWRLRSLEDRVAPVWTRILDRLLLSPIIIAGLAMNRQVPWRLHAFLDFAEDAFLLKRSASGIEFMHRELRDHFALRSLLPRITQEAVPSASDIHLLGLHGEASLNVLGELAARPQPSVRAAAVVALSRISHHEARHTVRKLAADTASEVRAAVVTALLRQPQDLARPVFRHMEPLTSGAEMEALLSAPNLGDQLLALQRRGSRLAPRPTTMDDDEEEDNFFAVQDFVRRMGPAAIGPLKAAIGPAKDSLRMRLALAYLVWLGTSDACSAVIDQIGRVPPARRFAMVDALGKFDQSDALDELRRLSRGDNRQVRQRAKESLAFAEARRRHRTPQD